MINNTCPDISVVIPVRNGALQIEQCLQAVLGQTIPPREILVIDGHSTDNTVDIAKRFSVTVLYEDYGTVGGARQVGVENANGDYIAFTDVDCIPQEDWLENLISEFDDNIIGVGGGIKNIGKGLWEESVALALDTFLGSANSVQDRVLKNRKIVKSISGCNSIYRRKDIISIGGFNVTLSVNEDTDLNIRLQQLGILIYTPDALVYHQQERGVKDFISRMYSFGYGRSANRLWDIQAIPPIVAIIAIFSMFICPQILIMLLYGYILIIGSYTFLIFFKNPRPAYLLSIPITFIIEHMSYTLGFWRGLIRSVYKRGSL